MSVQAITWALGFAVENATEKAVLLVLANYADGAGVCFPGQESIAEQAACSDRTVRRILDTFESRGVIARSERRRRDGSRTSDEIVLVAFQQPDTLSARPSATGHPVQTNRTPCPPSPDTVSGLTTFEPSEDTSGEPSCPAKPDGAPARDHFLDGWLAYPERGRVRSLAKAKTRPFWAKAAKEAGGAERLLAAVKSYARDGDHRGEAGPPGFHRWLRDGKWEHWLPDERARGPTDTADLEARRQRLALIESQPHV